MTEQRRIAELSPHPFNIEIYGKPDDLLRKNLEEFGLRYPLEIDAQNRILSGARRWQAAKAIGWRDIDVQVVSVPTSADIRRHILLANSYRAIKTQYQRAREAEALQELIRDGGMSREEVTELAVSKGRKKKPLRDTRPQSLAAEAAGISSTSYKEVTFITKPNRAEAQVKRARREGRISQADERRINRDIRKKRAGIKRGNLPASSAASHVRQQLRDAEEEQGYALEERRQREVDTQVDRIDQAGKKFTNSLHKLQHGATVKYLTSKHALRLAALLAEIEEAVSVLVHKAQSGSGDPQMKEILIGTKE